MPTVFVEMDCLEMNISLVIFKLTLDNLHTIIWGTVVHQYTLYICLLTLL